MSNNIGFGPMTDLDTPDKRKSVGNADPRLTRTNYFDGRLLTARDLIRDQHYLDDRTREVGRAIGSGIARGLRVSLSDRGLLAVEAGLAVAPSGRVLELPDRPLYLNLYDQALLSELNDGKSQVLENGLYAVALQYLEMGTDSAEVYPQDLSSERSFHYNSYTEGVEVVLVRLRTPLPQSNQVKGQHRLAGHRGLGARAALVPELVYRDGQPPELSGDAVALALLAVRDQRPLWLDLGLLRRPLRPVHSPLSLQQDLHTHYLELFDQVGSVRTQLGLRQDYPANLYFRQLPAHGPLPKDGLDPAAGTQTFFPKHISVTVAPVRAGDLPALIAESAPLDPIDLEASEPAEVMVVVPMSDTEFGWRARQLQHDDLGLSTAGHTRLAHIDPLALRLRDRPVPAHEIDTDASVWSDIWSTAQQLYFLRRPPRVAETQVSAVVLASGYRLPERGERPPADSAELEQQLADARQSLAECEQALEQAREALDNAAGADQAELDACRTRLRRAEQDLQSAREDLATATAEADAARSDAAGLEQDLRRAEDRVNTLQARLDGMDNGPDPELQARLDACEADAAQLRSRLQEALTRAALADSLQQERDRLEGELTTARARVADLEARITGGDPELQAQLAECERRVADLRDQLVEAREGAAQAGALQGELDRVNGELALAEDRVLELEQQLGDGDAALRARLVECEEVVIGLQDEMERVSGKLSECEDAATGLRGERDALSADLVTANGRITGLEQDLQQSDAARASCDSTLTGVRADLVRANNRIAQLEAGSGNNGDSARIAELEASVQDLQARLEDCRKNQGAPLDLRRAVAVRNVTSEVALAAATTLGDRAADDPALAATLGDVLLLVDRRYDSVLFPTLQGAVEKGTLGTFVDFLRQRDVSKPLGQSVSQAGANLGLTAKQQQAWAALDA